MSGLDLFISSGKFDLGLNMYIWGKSDVVIKFGFQQSPKNQPKNMSRTIFVGVLRKGASRASNFSIRKLIVHLNKSYDENIG